ncbi:unnamed protein product [Dovyalis caffra]|uniref:Uncharacterized protein n=1 Tax=Dovyalis caffra TaxID=77055 RepID=A0AAV1RU51_9ROSI|nr:unnamed protein product [Dovyalis caffra]
MAETNLSEIKIDLSSFSSRSKDDMLRQETNEGEENENNQLHQSEIKIDQISLALESGDDPLRGTANEGDEKENNQLQGEMVQEVPRAETQESSNSIKVESSLPSWLSKTEEEIIEPINNQPVMPKIPRVPRKVLEERTTKFYHPLAVSIGPCHYFDRKKKLAQVEKLKSLMMQQFVHESKMTKEGYRQVEKVALDARRFYSKTTTKKFSDEDFTKMMIIDGCFILQFIHCLKSEYEKLEMTDQQIIHVKRDLLLLENQLPLSVLESLMRLRYETEDEGKQIIDYFLSLHVRQPVEQIPKWVWIILTPVQLVMTPIIVLLLVPLVVPLCCIICCCCRGAFKNLLQDIDQAPPPPRADLDRSASPLNRSTPSEEKKEATGDDEKPAHLLGLLYSKFMSSQEGKRTKRPHGSRGHYLFYSAKNLKKVGIRFRPSETGALTDVKFNPSYFSGTLKLPPVTIDASTKSILLNLVAYETCTAACQLWVTSYICFMNSLIEDAEDVEELRSKGILFNYLGSDQQVADLFNNMSYSMKPDAAAYNDIKRDINKQCESIIKRWVSEWKRTYFRSPWTVITVLAASLGLGLTAAQTYYAIP